MAAGWVERPALEVEARPQDETIDCLAFHGQGRDDMLPANDLAYVKLVGRLARLGRRATEGEVREFFAPYEEWAGLAGTYMLRASSDRPYLRAA